MQRDNSSFSGVFAVIVASIIWGTTGTAASFSPDVSPLATGAFAMGVAGILLVLRSLRSLRRNAVLLRKNRVLLVVGALSVAVYPLAFYSSMRLSGVAIGTVISIATAPLFTVILERLISKKAISAQWFLSFLFGSAGVILLTLGKQGGETSGLASGSQHWGILLGLVAALAYAVYSWTARKLILKGISSDSALAGQFGLASLILLPSLHFTGSNLLTGQINIAVAVYMAIVPMFVGYMLFGFGLKHIEASKATLITLLEPAVATLLAIWVVGETFSIVGLTGMLAIAVCIALQMIKIPQLARVPNSY
ncbi:DMT family transporter [Vibrio sp. HN007]|uniref:DMT family transporter n=1 Tax=Vibrio iocasae TaxID=3098914 RepID=UPI0035D4B78D